MKELNYQEDSSGNKYLEIPFGWDDPEQFFRITFVKPNNDKKEPTIRFSKFAEGRNYPGPEPDFNNIPLIAQAILKIYNDFK